MNIKRLGHVMFLIVVLVSLLTTTLFYIFGKFLGSSGVTVQLFNGGNDGVFYWHEIQRILLNIPWSHTSYYPLFMSVFARLTNDVYIVRIANLFGYLLAIQIMWGILKEIIDESNINYFSRILVSLFVLFYFSYTLNVFSSITRDVWINVFFLLCIYFFIKMLKTNQNLKYIFLLFISLFMLYLFRKYSVLSFLVATILFYIYKKYGLYSILMLFIVFIGWYLLLPNFKLPYLSMSLSDVIDYRNLFVSSTSGGSQLGFPLMKDNFFIFLFSYILSLFGNSFGPFPTQLNSFTYFFLFVVESLPFFLACCYLIRKYKKFSEIDIFLIFQIIIWFSLIALSNDNIGTATRLRSIGYLLIIILFSKNVAYDIYLKFENSNRIKGWKI